MNKYRAVVFAAIIFAALALPAAHAAETFEGLEYALRSDYAEIVRYNEDEARITVPEELEGKPVRVIAEGAFSGKSVLSSVNLPDTVTEIGDGAFKGSIRLTKVTLPSGAIKIGRDAFTGTALYNNSSNWSGSVLYIGTHLIRAGKPGAEGSLPKGEYTVSASTRSIAAGAFADCENMTAVNLPEKLEIIGDYAFEGCSSLEAVELMGEPSYLGDGAFLSCSGLSYFELMGSLGTINDETFRGCKSLRRLCVPNGITAIGDEAFMDCTGLRSVEIADGVESIGAMAFKGCGYITEVYIPDSVRSLGTGAFANCKKLSDITGGLGLEEVGSTVFGGTAFASDEANKESGVLYFGACLLDGRKAAGDITVKAGTKVIASKAFDPNNKMTVLRLPKSLVRICSDAFWLCSRLVEVHYEGGPNDWEKIFIGSGNTKFTDVEPVFAGGPEIYGLSVSAAESGLQISFKTYALPTDAAVFAAAYGSGGELLGLARARSGAAALPFAGAARVKVFAWSPEPSLKPLCPCGAVNVN